MTSETLPNPKTKEISVKSCLVLFAAVLQLTFSPGPLIFGAWGLFAPHITDAMHINRGGFMLALTIINIGTIFSAPFAGYFLDKIGVRKMLIFAILCLVAGYAAIALTASNIYIIYFICFFWGMLTIGAQSISFSKLLTIWFVKNRGLALGISAAGLGLGYALVPLITSWGIEHFGWKGAMLCLSAVVLIGPLLISVPLAMPKTTKSLIGSGDSETKVVATEGLSGKEAIKTPQFWLLFTVILLVSTALTGLTPQIFLISGEKGLDKVAAAEAASFYGIATIIGRVLAGFLLDRSKPLLVTAGMFTCSVIGYILMANAPFGNYHFIFATILLLGLGFGAESDIIGFMIARYFGRVAFGQIYGYLLTAFIIGAAMGPPLYGYSHDLSGNYIVSLYSAAAVCLVAVLLTLSLGKFKTFSER